MGFSVPHEYPMSSHTFTRRFGKTTPDGVVRGVLSSVDILSPRPKALIPESVLELLTDTDGREVLYTH